MLKKSLFISFILLLAISAQSQNRFNIIPAQPEPGDMITITYQPVAGITEPEAIAFIASHGEIRAIDMNMKKVKTNMLLHSKQIPPIILFIGQLLKRVFTTPIKGTVTGRPYIIKAKLLRGVTYRLPGITTVGPGRSV